MDKENLKLRPVEYNDLDQLRDWRNDSEIMMRTRQWRMLSLEDQDAWFKNLYKKWPDDVMYIIDYEGYDAGVCGLCHIDYIGRSAEVSLYVGDKDYRSQGLAILVLDELKRIAFNDMNLHNIWAEIYDFNKPSVGLFEKSGFIEAGHRNASVFKDGQYYMSQFYIYFGEK